jgi:hypothetical protein
MSISNSPNPFPYQITADVITGKIESSSKAAGGLDKHEISAEETGAT